MAQTWNPWRALRERGESTELWFAPLAERRGLWVRRRGGRDEIYLDERLGRRERREVLAHELVHAERGVGHDGAATAATMAKEEELVWREALRRLAPPAEVERFLGQTPEEAVVTVPDLADEFDLSLGAAQRLASLLATSSTWAGSRRSSCDPSCRY